MIELGGGYAEGAEELYVQRLEAARKKDQHRQRQQHHSHQDHHHDQHQQNHQQNHHQNHQQQEHHQHHERQDHLSSFVDLDFEHFVPGQVEDIEPPRPTKSRVIQNTHHNNHHNNRNHNHNHHPGNFSVLVSGLAKNPNPKELAKLFKEGAVDEDKHKAFITGQKYTNQNSIIICIIVCRRQQKISTYIDDRYIY